MKYTPRRLRENVNISREHPLKEFLLLAGGLCAILLLAYVVLGFALDLVVPRIGPEFESRLGELFFSGEDELEAPPAEGLQGLLDELSSLQGEGAGRYRLRILRSEEANAVALPGGTVVIYSGLLERAGSENEVAMVIGHELGHFRGRDHLRGLGRGLVVVFLSSLLFGADSAPARLASSVLSGAEMQFSQRQELAADTWGLELLVKKYGHAGGATDFFARAAEEGDGGALASLFASHPFPKERVMALRELIDRRGYRLGETAPLKYIGVSP